MAVKIDDPQLEIRLGRQMEILGTSSVEQALRHLLDTQEELDDWLLANRSEINQQISEGLEELDRGDLVTEDHLDAYLADLRRTRS